MEKVDLVLIRPNDKKEVYGTVPSSATASDPPYWLALMGGYMRKKGLSVKLIDAEGENISPEETVQRVKEYNPVLVGILTIGSNLTASTWKMNGASIWASAIREGCPEVHQFIWGYHVSAIPEKTLQEEAVDYVICGEGFETIIELLAAIKAEASSAELEKIDGLWYRTETGDIQGNRKMRLIQNFDELPYDGWDMLPTQCYRNHLHFAFGDLSKRDKYGAIMTSLGCPFNCTYCAISYFSGDKKQRFKSTQKAIEEVDYWVKNYDVHYLRILDECFTFNRQHVIDFCNALIERKYNLSIWINARADLVDKELLVIMKKAGIDWIGYGFESGSRKIRGNVQKAQYTEEQIMEVVQMTHEAGISICSNFMFGLPGDDKESMQESLDFARKICCEWPNFYCTMAYPGSRMYEEAVANGGAGLPDSWLGYTQLGYETCPFPTEKLTSAEILAFRDYAFDAFFENNPKYWENIQNKFGSEAVQAIEKLLQNKLKRRLLENEK